MMRLIQRWLAEEYGASAAEFALLTLPMAVLLFGIIHLCLMTYAATRLNFATEATARCIVVSHYATGASVTSPGCSSTATDLAYLRAMYSGPTPPPTFVSSPDASQTCTGTPQVVAQVDYPISAIIVNKTVTFTAQACFPYS